MAVWMFYKLSRPTPLIKEEATQVGGSWKVIWALCVKEDQLRHRRKKESLGDVRFQGEPDIVHSKCQNTTQVTLIPFYPAGIKSLTCSLTYTLQITSQMHHCASLVKLRI